MATPASVSCPDAWVEEAELIARAARRLPHGARSAVVAVLDAFEAEDDGCLPPAALRARVVMSAPRAVESPRRDVSLVGELLARVSRGPRERRVQPAA